MRNIASLVLNYSTLLGGGRSSRVNGRTHRVRNYKKLLLAALLIGAASTAYAWIDCGTNLQYEIDGTTLRFLSPDPTKPATIGTIELFMGNTTITSFSLPENVTMISTQAFNGCTALTHVDLGNVQTISSYAFYGCTALQEVVIPPTVNKIMGYAFYGCTSLTDVLCRPYPAPTLGTDAFTGCAEGLKICVSSLGEYRNKDVNWKAYYDNLKLVECFLDEYDEQTIAEDKISTFRSTRTDIDLFRTLRKAGCFNTLTLPFSVSLSGSPLDGDNVEVYEFAGAAVVDGALQLDITPLTGNTLSAGTPYLIQWTNTGEVLNRMHFSGITWDTDEMAEDAGSTEVTYHGFYGKTHINDETEAEQHLNLFLGGGNQLFWPTDGDDANAKMLGFRAWFRINGSSVSGAPIRRGMPATLRIVATPTGVEDPVTPNPSPLIRKEFRNGQLVIIRNGQTFSLNGQRL